VLWVDSDNHRFAMERIDSRLENWRSRLEVGEVDLQTAARVGELLGQLHTRSAECPGLAQRFANRTFFEQLRIEPFFLRCAQRNPELAPAISEVIDTLRLPGTALVHGDYSPKNLLVSGRDVVILDCEVAHWGDPRFDVAFCLSHLLLSGWRSSTSARAFRDAALSFAHAYRLQRSPSCSDAMLVRMIGCLVLARLEGDSPVDHLDELDLLAVKASAVQLIRSHERLLLPLISCLLR
jgi:aminoglycoside phosphotransferase (APT) family kinase protein